MRMSVLTRFSSPHPFLCEEMLLPVLKAEEEATGLRQVLLLGSLYSGRELETGKHCREQGGSSAQTQCLQLEIPGAFEISVAGSASALVHMGSVKLGHYRHSFAQRDTLMWITMCSGMLELSVSLF